MERIRSGQIRFGRHILATDIEDSIDDTDAVYIAMIHAVVQDDAVRLKLGQALLRRVMESHEKRRPQLVLARAGTHAGRTRMDGLGFDRFGAAPHIEATFTDKPEFVREVERRLFIQRRREPGERS